MYNLLEYSGEYSTRCRPQWNYHRDEVSDKANENNNANNCRTNNMGQLKVLNIRKKQQVAQQMTIVDVIEDVCEDGKQNLHGRLVLMLMRAGILVGGDFLWLIPGIYG